MPIKCECEVAIRSLASTWANERGEAGLPTFHASFGAFVTWLRSKGGGQYLDFRSRAGSLYDAEMWFDQEMKQSWKN